MKRSMWMVPLAVLAAACESGQVTEPVREPLEHVVAFDDVANNLDADIDVTEEAMQLTVGGSNGTAQLYITPRNLDGKNGCNLTGSTTLMVSVVSGNTAVATVSPASITFASCGDTPTLTITPQGVGTTTITLGQTSNTTGGTFNLAPATFTVTVNPAVVTDPTPPVITPGVSGTLGNNDWYTSDVTVTWSVVDGESGISSSTGCTPTTISTDTPGTTLTCEATSAGGTTSVSVTIKRDATAPTISGSRSPAANAAGWNNTDVAVSFICDDNLSGIASCTSGQTFSGEGAGQSATGIVLDNAGNSNSATVGDINIDKTAPTASASASPAANSAGWNNTNVTVTFEGTDALSGIQTCTAPVALSNEEAGQTASGTCTDLAGNVSTTATASGINIDKTAPTGLLFVGGPTPGGSYYWGSVPSAPTCTASDLLSGVASCTVTGYAVGIGSHTLTATALDIAGNSATAERSYTVLSWNLTGFYAPVSMGDAIYNTVKSGATVPLKFEVFADEELTSTTAVKSFVQQVITCANAAAVTEDPVEVVSTGGTSLRYDAVEGQFIQNWQTPKNKAGTCYKVVMTTQDGSRLQALFKLK